MALRLLTEKDLPLILGWRNALDVRKQMFTSHVISEMEHRTWFEKNCLDPSTFWYIHENHDNNPDGVVGFTRYDQSKRTAFWGFYLGKDAIPGSGLRLGFDALDEAFLRLNLHKLNAEVLAGNDKSLAFHQKLGFRQEGCFREHHFNGKSYLDVYRFGLTEKDWQQKREDINSLLVKNR